MSETTQTVIVDTTANPAPLGLFGFGMTTILLNMHNFGMFGLTSMILAMGIFYGGIAQVIAGIMEWKKKNTFGTVAFISYGFFWITLVALLWLPKAGFEAPDAKSMSAFLGIWGFFSLVFFIATFKLSRALQVIFGLLVVLFILLAVGKANPNETLETFTGAEGILCGLSAFYAGAAQIINEYYGRTVLPLG